MESCRTRTADAANCRQNRTVESFHDNTKAFISLFINLVAEVARRAASAPFKDGGSAPGEEQKAGDMKAVEASPGQLWPN